MPALKWTDADEIGFELNEKFPDLDPLGVRFTDMHKLVVELPPLDDVRSRAQRQLAEFHAAVKRFVNPHRYPVGLEMGLHQRKTNIILEERGLTR